MSDPFVRPGLSTDADLVAAVCVATAEAGRPQPVDVADPDLVALVYARPYLALEPQTSRVLIDEGTIVGYVVGAVHSPSFYRRWRAEWTGRHLPRPAGADPGLVRLLTHPELALPPDVVRYPSHLHVNLLPAARGGGLGARLVHSFLGGLAAAGSPGVHLRVNADNTRAQRFYERLGFARHGGDDTVTMVRVLTPAGG